MKRTSESLFWPFFVISVGFIASMAFVIYALLNYKKPTPLVIKPSSVSNVSDIAEGIHKALFPLTQLEEHFIVLSEEQNDNLDGDLGDNNDFSKKLQTDLNTFFKPSTKKALNLKVYKVHLSLKDTDPQLEDPKAQSSCEKLSLFNLQRKKDRVWDQKFIFTLCREKDDEYLLVYDKN